MPPRALHLTRDHVARTFRQVPRTPEVPEDWGWHRLEEGEVIEAGERLLDTRPGGPLRIFAYGSLIWKPEFEPTSTLRARLDGWHRAFCIEMTSWRGTPEAPGLMMALLPGGTCTGLVLEVPESGVREAAIALVRREIPYRELLPCQTWVTADTSVGPVQALTFYAPPLDQDIRQGLTMALTAGMIARACGFVGPNSEYLRETVEALEAHGIRDGRLWRLQRLVAAEIEALA